jgi:hypothetical protein
LDELKGKLRHAVLVDGRNLFDKDQARTAGFTYLGVGNTV